MTKLVPATAKLTSQMMEAAHLPSVVADKVLGVFEEQIVSAMGAKGEVWTKPMADELLYKLLDWWSHRWDDG